MNVHKLSPLVLLVSACGFFGGGARGNTPAGSGGGSPPGGGSGGGGGGGAAAAGGPGAPPADACVKGFSEARTFFENREALGRSSAFRCSGFDVGALREWLTLQAVGGGRKGISQLGLAELYAAEVRNGSPYAGTLGKRLDEKLLEAQLEGRPDSEKQYQRARFREVKAQLDSTGGKAPGRDLLGEWLSAWDAEPKIFQAALEMRKTVLDPLKNATIAFLPSTWKFTPIAACAKARERFFEIAPASEPMNATELAKRFNTLPRLGLLELLRDCGYYEGDRGLGDGFGTVLAEVRATARWADKANHPSGDVDTTNFLSPFASYQGNSWYNEASGLRLAPVTDLDHYGCKVWPVQGTHNAATLEAEYSIGWGEIAATKDTADGVLVTFKKQSWMQDKIECDVDTSSWSYNGVSWQPSRRCTKKGVEKAEHQEAATLIPKIAAKEVKAGRMMSLVNYACAGAEHGYKPRDAKLPRQGLPVFVHSNGKEFKPGNEVQFFFWPVKRDKKK